MDPRRIVLAVTGGIAAYKVPELVRALTGAGHAVRCVLTPEATRFVSPLVLETLSQHPAGDDLFDSSSGEIDHIAVADDAAGGLVERAEGVCLGECRLRLG